MTFRAKAYGNRHADEDSGGNKIPNKLQVSGDLADFAKLVKEDPATVEAFNTTVSEALPRKK